MVAFPHPDLKNASRYKANSKGEASVDAHYFINHKNKWFKFYCKAVGLDPLCAEKNMRRTVMYEILKEQKEYFGKLIKNEDKKCIVDPAVILTQLLYELGMTIRAIQLCVGESVLDAA